MHCSSSGVSCIETMLLNRYILNEVDDLHSQIAIRYI